MKFRILLIVFSVMVFNGFCANSISISANVGLNFNCNSTTDLETDQTLTNALTISIVNGSGASSVYVKISTFNHPANWTLVGPYPLSVIYVSDNSPNATNIAGTTVLTTSNQLLFKQPKHNASYSFNYNLKLAALGYVNYVPGSYNYTFTFTMTEP